MNKKIHKNSSKLKNFLNIKELVQKTNIPKIIKANPINSAKKSINKFYQDYKKIKEREELKKECRGINNKENKKLLKKIESEKKKTENKKEKNR